MCSFSASADERQQLRPPSGPWTFYAWCDEQAGSLRFSLVPGTASDPRPFGARLEFHDDASQICDAFVTGTSVIPWSELNFDAPHVAPHPYVLPVFRRQLIP